MWTKTPSSSEYVTIKHVSIFSNFSFRLSLRLSSARLRRYDCGVISQIRCTISVQRASSADFETHLHAFHYSSAVMTPISNITYLACPLKLCVDPFTLDEIAFASWTLFFSLPFALSSYFTRMFAVPSGDDSHEKFARWTRERERERRAEKKREVIELDGFSKLVPWSANRADLCS